jgi:glyoxylate reductase
VVTRLSTMTLPPSRLKVFVTARLADEVLKDLREAYDVDAHLEDHSIGRDRLLASVADKEGLIPIITDTVDSELLDRAPKLRVVANFGVGYNNIDVNAATERGILVTNTPDVLTDATADLTFALILALARRIVELDALTRRGDFKVWAPMLNLSREVTGKVLGIIGMGRIGRAVARRAVGFGMRVLYYDPRRMDEASDQALTAEQVSLGTLLNKADFVSLHVPLTEETTHLISSRELQLMKKDSYLINVSRGPVVDEKALVAALKAGTIAGAGLDVYENEPALAPGLTDLVNVVLLPHVGSATIETRTKMARLAFENLRAALAGDIPPNLVNPEVLPKRRS